jgi:hypothetical protein
MARPIHIVYALSPRRASRCCRLRSGSSLGGPDPPFHIPSQLLVLVNQQVQCPFLLFSLLIDQSSVEQAGRLAVDVPRARERLDGGGLPPLEEDRGLSGEVVRLPSATTIKGVRLLKAHLAQWIVGHAFTLPPLGALRR